jgi:hypothetical protein
MSNFFRILVGLFVFVVDFPDVFSIGNLFKSLVILQLASSNPHVIYEIIRESAAAKRTLYMVRLLVSTTVLIYFLILTIGDAACESGPRPSPPAEAVPGPTSTGPASTLKLPEFSAVHMVQ